MDSVNVKGLSDLQKFMDTLTAKMEANVMRGALRAGIKPVQVAAKAGAAVSSGLLRDGLKVYTNIKYRTVTATLRATGKHGYLARWIEFGTAAHAISAKNGNFLSIGDGFVKSVSHPGSRPHPFMRPALDGQAQAAVVAAGEYIKKRLSTKEGLDTSDVNIEGES